MESSIERAENVKADTRQFLDELEQNRVINAESYRIVMNYRLQKQLEKDCEKKELYRRIEKLEYQVSILLNSLPGVSEENK